jgi:hypothetical protein
MLSFPVIAPKCPVTSGGVLVADSVVSECVKTNRHVIADCGARERVSTYGRAAPHIIAPTERVETDRRVVESGREGEECIFALSSVAAGIASVRCRRHRTSGKRKRKAGERQRDDKKTRSLGRPADRNF